MRGATALALGACALGFACGHVARRQPDSAPVVLAPAGTPRDDGSGFLARASGRGGIGGGAAEAQPIGGARYGGGASTYGGTTYGGATYGGATYGGRTYGGSLYANYQFDFTPTASQPPGPYGAYSAEVSVTNGGSIEGVVTWPQAPAVPSRLAVPAGHSTACDDGIANRTLVMGRGGVVTGAVVYLEGISRGRAIASRGSNYTTRPLQLGGGLEWRACALHPHVQVVAPIGSVLGVTSADESIALAGLRLSGLRDSVFSVDLGAAGATRDLQMARDGFVEVRPQVAGHPANGWVVVAPHPYYVITDDRGRFTIDEIPAGTYTLVVWHEPVVVGVGKSGEAIVSTPPLVKRRVVVRARQVAKVGIKLPAVKLPAK